MHGKKTLKQSKSLTVSCIDYKPITCTMKRFFVVKTKLWNLLKIFLFPPSIKSLFPYPMLRPYSKSSKEPFWLQIGKQTRWIKLTCTTRGGKLNHGPDVHKPRVFRTVKKSADFIQITDTLLHYLRLTRGLFFFLLLLRKGSFTLRFFLLRLRFVFAFYGLDRNW